MKVSELMNRKVATIGAGESLAHAVELMLEHDCGCIPVIGKAKELVGILTDRDVCLAALRTDRPLSKLGVDAAMTADVFTCTPRDDVAVAEAAMGQHQVRRLPVVDDQRRVCGILSLDDLARRARADVGTLAPPLREDSVGRTLGEITRKRLERESDA
jgi:CBS domain-containing protein